MELDWKENAYELLFIAFYEIFKDVISVFSILLIIEKQRIRRKKMNKSVIKRILKKWKWNWKKKQFSPDIIIIMQKKKKINIIKIKLSE